MDTIGSRIRQLRKQQKYTLEALAGNQLTKGMLSLIENGKAQPSMESLSYIAQRLGVESSELMEDVSQTEKRNLLEQVEKLYNVYPTELKDEYTQIIELIHPVVEKLSLSYESARLLDIYSRCSYNEKRSDWEKYYHQAMNYYEQLHLHNQRASLALFKGMIQFITHDYGEALNVVLQEHASIDAPLDAMTTIDYLYVESILFSAVGDYEKARTKMQEALLFSKEQRTFYRMDDLYRLACFQAIINENEEDRIYYLLKVRQYGEFAENKDATAIAELLEAHYYNSFSHDYENALKSIENFLKENKDDSSDNHYLLEKGKALYGLGQIENALALLSQYKVPKYLHHPYDLSMSYEVHTYLALCHDHLGDSEKALNEAKTAYDLIIDLPETPYKKFIMNTYLSLTDKYSTNKKQ
ncbi:helix-turn-helix domain-containing protein [Paenisporosarcina quisquiliarum]|uniref:helix-turn-helix domain-containing protein n=1 Tax=Paenisporosarcina quisquiliarum TaxID=365346 RepID=UPI003735773B